MGGVAQWFERQGEIPLTRPPAFREYVPVADDPDRPDHEFEDRAIRGLAFALEYCDLHGWVSSRTIRCLALNPAKPACLKAYCNVRGATGTFRLDRIVAITHLRTGQILTGKQHVALLAPYLPGETDDPELASLCALQPEVKDGVFALLHLAMAEGKLRLRSRQIVLDYVRAEADAMRHPLIPSDTIGFWIDNLSPPLDAVVASVEHLLTQKEKLTRLLPWLLKVVRSWDSSHIPEERVLELIEEIRQHFRKEPPLDTPANIRARR
jgi:hypothetical protein